MRLQQKQPAWGNNKGGRFLADGWINETSKQGAGEGALLAEMHGVCYWESGEPCAHGNLLILYVLSTHCVPGMALTLLGCPLTVSSRAMQRGHAFAGFAVEGPTGIDSFVDRTSCGCWAAWGPGLCNFNTRFTVLICSKWEA